MRKIIVKTGIGYMKDNITNEITYCRLLPGEQPINSNFTYFEVDSWEKLPPRGNKKERIALIKNTTNHKINSILSETKQHNSLYTLYKHGKKAKSSLTVDEKAEIQDLESKWGKIEAIREVSNKIEAEINNLQTIEEVQNYDIINNPLWHTT